MLLLKTYEFHSYNRSEEVENMCTRELTPYECNLISKEVLEKKRTNPEVEQHMARCFVGRAKMQLQYLHKNWTALPPFSCCLLQVFRGTGPAAGCPQALV